MLRVTCMPLQWMLSDFSPKVPAGACPRCSGARQALAASSEAFQHCLSIWCLVLLLTFVPSAGTWCVAQCCQKYLHYIIYTMHLHHTLLTSLAQCRGLYDVPIVYYTIQLCPCPGCSLTSPRASPRCKGMAQRMNAQ